MRYEWDEAKNRSNQRKHGGISFEIATLVFEDERCIVVPDRTDESGEQRWHAIGAACGVSSSPAVLLVVHASREEFDGEEVVRIISARRAETDEVRRYQEEKMDRE